MLPKNEKSIRCALHCHSSYSPDSNVPLEHIIEACKFHRINVIALTDHNEIAGAIKLKEMAPAWLKVIIGEEVSSREGHIIGLFLHKKIEPGLSIDQTILEIKQQGGVILLPHPFDAIRPGSVGGTVATRILRQIDFLETFNARCLRDMFNDNALEFAKNHNLKPYVGADAHFANEYGNAICEMAAFTTKDQFVRNLEQATFITRPAGWLVHVRSNYMKHIGKRFNLFFD